MPFAAFIPSMFHRRLLLLGGALLCGMAILLARTLWLTVVRGDDLRRKAEARLVSDAWTPTVRGRILDRKGRVLAEDRPTYDVAVDYRVLSGEWAYVEAAKVVRRANIGEWKKLGLQRREELIQERLPEYEAKVRDMWRAVAGAAGVPLEDLEARRHDIVERVSRMASTIWARRAELEREAMRKREADADDDNDMRPALPIAEQEQPHVVLRDVTDEVAFRLRALADQYPGLAVIDSAGRRYPYESMQVEIDRTTLPSPLASAEPAIVDVRGVATHILGWMRETPRKEDYDARAAWFAARRAADPSLPSLDRGRYEPADPVGAMGLEAAFESGLRGLRGRLIRHLDTGEEELEPAAAGADVTLTLDVALQARVQAVLEPNFGLTRIQTWHAAPKEVPLGWSLASAAVVIDVGSGDILAMASAPTFTREQLRAGSASIFAPDGLAPWLNRPLARPYEPGSIVKPLVLCEAVSRGVHALDRAIDCTGHFLPNNQNILRCWIYRPQFGMSTHGPLRAVEAIARSCNMYFYTLGRALGLDGMQELYRKLGVGERYDLGLSEAVPGFLGLVGGGEWSPIDSTIMAIGQGPVSWTPLHAADAYATLARRGLRLSPRLVQGAPQRATDLRWDARAVEAALKGLYDGAHEPYGTAHHVMVDGAREPIFNVPGVRIVAKTGTAQASPPLVFDTIDEAGIAVKTPVALDHAWTVCLVGEEGAPPRFAIAVVAEYAGSGGKVAGPLANQIIWALVEEGYLETGPKRSRRAEALQ